MDGEHTFRLQHPQRIAQRLQGNVQQLHQLALRNEGADRHLALEQPLEDAAVGDLTQAARVRRLAAFFGYRQGTHQLFGSHPDPSFITDRHWAISLTVTVIRVSVDGPFRSFHARFALRPS